MNEKELYTQQINWLGRIGILITLILLFSIPTIIGLIYGAMPSFRDFILGASGVLIIYIPIGVSEVFIYSPILGSSSYLTFITGNILNLKVPVAVNAQQVAGVRKGTEEGDVVSALAVGVSSMLTIFIIILGVLLLAPLKPILTDPQVKTAGGYIIPALFGALFVMVTRPSGEIKIQNKLSAGIVPFLIILIVNLFVIPLGGYEGIILIMSIPLTLLAARILYNRGIIKIISIN
jgi:hypothetical protein